MRGLITTAIVLINLFCSGQDVEYAALVKKDRDWGAIDSKGNYIVSSKYALISRPHEFYMPYYSEEKEMLFPPKNGLFKFRMHGTYGFLKPGDEEVIKDIYEKATSFRDGYSIVYDGFHYWMINTNGEDVVKKSRFPLLEYNDGKLLYKKGNKFGYLSYQGKGNIPPKFREAQGFSGGYACVCEKKFWGVIDTNGLLVIDFQYKDMRSFGNGLFAGKKNGNWEFIDQTGKRIISPEKYTDVSGFQNGVCAVKTITGWGLIDKSGELLIPCFYEELEIGETIRARSVGGWIFFNLDGTKISNKVFSRAGSFFEGLTWAKENSGYGIIDRTGEWVIKPIFDNARNCANGLCAVSLNGKWGFVDTNGKTVIEFIFEDATQLYPIGGF